MTTVRSEARLQHSLGEITRLLEKHRVLESLTHRQEGPRRDLLENLQQRQNEAELRKRLRLMHAADLAYVLEALPLEYRRTVWHQVPPDLAGTVFVEVSAAVRDSLVAVTPAAGPDRPALDTRSGRPRVRLGFVARGSGR